MISKNIQRRKLFSKKSKQENDLEKYSGKKIIFKKVEDKK